MIIIIQLKALTCLSIFMYVRLFLIDLTIQFIINFILGRLLKTTNTLIIKNMRWKFNCNDNLKASLQNINYFYITIDHVNITYVNT